MMTTPLNHSVRFDNMLNYYTNHSERNIIQFEKASSLKIEGLSIDDYILSKLILFDQQREEEKNVPPMFVPAPVLASKPYFVVAQANSNDEPYLDFPYAPTPK